MRVCWLQAAVSLDIYLLPLPSTPTSSPGGSGLPIWPFQEGPGVGPTEVGLGSAGTSSMLELWLPELGSFLGPAPVPPGGVDEGSPTEMGWKAWELFPALLWALHSYVLLCSKVPMASRLWTVTLWKGSWLRTLVCGSSNTSSAWASSHLGRAVCGSGFQGAQPLIPGEEGERSPLTYQYGPCTAATSRWAGGTQRRHRVWHQSH